jgi:CelD/BcsL family acetyltransferase involved in cellulose biosynthesis
LKRTFRDFIELCRDYLGPATVHPQGQTREAEPGCENCHSLDEQEILRIVLHREIPDDDLLARQWNELVCQMECPEVFYTYEWALAVSHAYRVAITPLLILAYEQDSLVGVAALATDQTRRETFFLAAATADYCDFVSSPASRLEFVNLVFSELSRLRMPGLVAASVPSSSTTSYALATATQLHGYRTFSRPAFSCAQIVVGPSVEQRNRKESVASHKALRYCLRGLGKHAPVNIEHLKSRDSLNRELPDFMRAHIARFSATGRRSNLADPERRAFLTELAGLLSASGQMALSLLRVGDHPIAWNYGFQFSGSWFYYQPTFDGDWRQYSPGLCLLSKIVEAACDDPQIERVDMGLGAEAYKERFATGVRQTLDFTATRSTTRYLREAARYHVAAAIKHSPRLEYGVRRMLGRVPAGVAQD